MSDPYSPFVLHNEMSNIIHADDTEILEWLLRVNDSYRCDSLFLYAIDCNAVRCINIIIEHDIHNFNSRYILTMDKIHLLLSILYANEKFKHLLDVNILNRYLSNVWDYDINVIHLILSYDILPDSNSIRIVIDRYNGTRLHDMILDIITSLSSRCDIDIDRLCKVEAFKICLTYGLIELNIDNVHKIVKFVDESTVEILLKYAGVVIKTLFDKTIEQNNVHGIEVLLKTGMCTVTADHILQAMYCGHNSFKVLLTNADVHVLNVLPNLNVQRKDIEYLRQFFYETGVRVSFATYRRLGFTNIKTFKKYCGLPHNLGQQQIRDCLYKLGITYIGDEPLESVSKETICKSIIIDKRKNVTLFGSAVDIPKFAINIT